MATKTLIPLSTATSPLLFGIPIADLLVGFVGVGSSDLGVCLQTALDGNTAHCDDTVSAGLIVYVYMEDDGDIPVSATIDSVQVSVRHAATVVGVNMVAPALQYYSAGTVASGIPFVGITDPTGTFAYQTSVTAALTVNPVTSHPWTRADLFSSNPATTGDGAWSLVGDTSNIPSSYDADKLNVIVTYTAVAGTDWYYNPDTKHYVFSGADPGDPWLLQADAPVPAATATFVNDTITDDVASEILTEEDEIEADTVITPGNKCCGGGFDKDHMCDACSCVRARERCGHECGRHSIYPH